MESGIQGESALDDDDGMLNVFHIRDLNCIKGGNGNKNKVSLILLRFQSSQSSELLSEIRQQRWEDGKWGVGDDYRNWIVKQINI